MDEREAQAALTFANQAAHELRRLDAGLWRERIQGRLQELDAAFEWFLDHDAAEALAMASTLAEFLRISGRATIARSWLDRALTAAAAAAADDPRRAEALTRTDCWPSGRAPTRRRGPSTSAAWTSPRRAGRFPRPALRRPTAGTRRSVVARAGSSPSGQGRGPGRERGGSPGGRWPPLRDRADPAGASAESLREPVGHLRVVIDRLPGQHLHGDPIQLGVDYNAHLLDNVLSVTSPLSSAGGDQAPTRSNPLGVSHRGLASRRHHIGAASTSVRWRACHSTRRRLPRDNFCIGPQSP
jgi:hypothetical protein